MPSDQLPMPARRSAPRLPMTLPPPAPGRRDMLAKIHIARKELAMTEDAYRDMLARVTGATSASALSVAQLDAVLAELKRLGWKPPAPKAKAHSAQARMIYAMWKEMGQDGILLDRSKDALRAFCKRQTGVDAPEFLRAQQATKVAEGLKAWRRRVLAERAAPAPAVVA